MVKKSWEKKVDNKGFTLVELIVVLVILAILAAILVPALLGYIDRAKGSQILLNAKSVMTAAQAEVSNLYGTSSDETNNVITDNVVKKIRETADVPTTASFAFSTGGSEAPSKDAHDAWTVQYVAYTEDGTIAVAYDFTTKSWTENLTPAEAKAIADKGGSNTFVYGSGFGE